MLTKLNTKANVKIPCIPEGVHEVLAVEDIHILVDSTHISLVANLVRMMSLEALPYLLVVAGTHLMVKEIPSNVAYVSQLIIGHKIVLTKSKMNMTRITVIKLYCSSQILIIHLQSLVVAESWNAAVLDCGVSIYIEILSNEEKSKITYDKSNSFYWFDGKKIPALKNVKIPALIGSQKVIIDTDIVSNKVPLLLLRESMERANMHLNFQDDIVSALGQTIDLIVTKSGHYAVPLTLPCQILNSVTNNSSVNVTLP